MHLVVRAHAFFLTCSPLFVICHQNSIPLMSLIDLTWMGNSFVLWSPLNYLIILLPHNEQCGNSVKGAFFSACVFFYCKSRFSLGLALGFLNRAVSRCFCFLIGSSSCWVCRRGFTFCVRRNKPTSSRSWTEGGRSALVSWWPRSRVLKRV
jgi:hypothetical protein